MSLGDKAQSRGRRPTSAAPPASPPCRPSTRWISAARRCPTCFAEFEVIRLGKEVDGEQYRDADAAFFRDLVTGVVRDQRELDPAIHAVLVADWPLPRIDITLRAILRSGAYELKCRPDVPARVVITEYVDVAKAFFDVDVQGMVNGVLDALARVLRPAEFMAPAARS